MLNTFFLSYKLKLTYQKNQIVNALSTLPFLGKYIKRFNNNIILKIIVVLININIEIIKTFAGKFLYILLIFLISRGNKELFLVNYFLLTLIGLNFNTYLFNPTKDKYYALVNLKMNAKEYVFSNYIFEMMKIMIGSTCFIVLFGLILGLKIQTLTLIPLIVISIKTIYNANYLEYSYKKNNIRSENTPSKLNTILAIFLFIISVILNYLNIGLKEGIIEYVGLILILLSILSFIKLYKFENYKKVYRKLLKHDNIIFNYKNIEAKSNNINISNSINYKTIETNKLGVEYFNEVFNQRHEKIIKGAAKKINLITLLVFIILIILSYIFKKDFNNIPLKFLPYLSLIMYGLNRGEVLTRAYFMNCDHSMLNYNFYKKPNILLKLFKERLITISKLNTQTALIIGIGLNLILLVSGGTSNFLYYLIIPISIIAMGIFFSVHYLVMYYLMQPYNLQSEMVNSKYRTVSLATYFIIYFTFDMQISSVQYGSAVILLTIIYIIISLTLVYKKATKTFKIN